MSLRQPIVAVLGHVDHGKTSLLDKIRGTTVALREPGSITQWIGASLIPAETLHYICGPLLKKFKFDIAIPGLLFVDTPGHETFSNLRRRGGSAADIAILVIDILKGIEPQTIESLEILINNKVPFLVAANKIDLISGWKSFPPFFLESLNRQSDLVKGRLDEYLYKIIGNLSIKGFKAERFDRIEDFKNQVSIVPTSAKNGEGIAELLTVLVGLTQAYMKQILKVTAGAGKATVLEVKEEPGLGVTLNTILYDGELKVNDRIVLGGRDEIIETKIRAILVPKPLDEIRDPQDRFNSVMTVTAAAGVKIAAPGLDSALSGSPIYVISDDTSQEEKVTSIKEEINQLRIKTDRIGIIVKSDTLGSLEALINSLGKISIPIRLADVGDLSKRDVIEAEVVKIKDFMLGVILCFNVNILPDAVKELEDKRIPVFTSNIIYQLIEDYTNWAKEQRLEQIKAELDILIRPGKVKVIQGHIFRRSKPAIIGVEVLAGIIKQKYPLLSPSRKRVGSILKIQEKGNDVQEAKEGSKVAVSIDDGVVGRNLYENDVLYVDVPSNHADILVKKYKDELSSTEFDLLKELEEYRLKI